MTTTYLPTLNNRKTICSLVIRIISIVFPLIVTFKNVDGQVVKVTIRRGLYLTTNNARWPNPLAVTSSGSLVECAVSCHDNRLCAAVNLQASTKFCEQVGYPLGPAPNPSYGWRSALLNKPAMTRVDMNGALAKQSSIPPYGGPPERGIDGNTNGHFFAGSCFHTANPYSWWLVELPHTTELAGVKIYFRTDCCLYRQGMLRFLVASSSHDSDAGVGTEVGFYEGPPTLADNPLQVVFRRSIFGKVFTIKHELNNALNLCEIVLKSPSY